VSDADFTGATQATGEPSPDVAGSPESFAVTGLSPDTLYYFALIDDLFLAPLAEGLTARLAEQFLQRDGESDGLHGE
jgi:hypothetical protein